MIDLAGSGSGKRVIKGVKKFGKKALKFTGKWGLKGLAGLAELGGTSIVSGVKSLVDDKGLQVAATTLGLVTAGVAFPPLGIKMGIGFLGTSGLKYIGSKLNSKERDKSLGESMLETLEMYNTFTSKICEKAFSPLLENANEKISKLGEKAQHDIDGMAIFK